MSEDGREGAAFLLCGRSDVERNPWDGGREQRFLSYAVEPLAPEDVLSASEAHVSTSTRTFARVLKRAKDDDLAVAFVHSHPRGAEQFSALDDRNERELVKMAQNRNGQGTELVSLVLTRGGGVFGRTWLGTERSEPLATARVLGERFAFHPSGGFGEETPESFHRQALAFGVALTAQLSALRVGIVGCGATGSATGMLLARLGVRNFLVVDGDTVDKTNLNRLHGATMDDALSGIPKVDVMRRHLEGMGLGATVVGFHGWVGDERFRDALKSCDIIFGCTDDHDGRLFLNRLAYFYVIPVFDMGIKIDPAKEPPPRISEAAGRATVLVPGARCLICYGVVNLDAAREEHLLRMDHQEYERQREQQYITRDGGPAPAVVTFTTDVACMAVDELVHRLTGYRIGSRANRVRKYLLLEDKQPGAKENTVCPVCLNTQYWGRGDVKPFLDRVG